LTQPVAFLRHIKEALSVLPVAGAPSAAARDGATLKAASGRGEAQREAFSFSASGSGFYLTAGQGKT
jgi:hypothetical protein